MASSKSRKRRKRRTRAAAGRDQAAGADAAPKPAAPAPRRPAADEPPPAPWGSFPLVELCVLAAIGVAVFVVAALLLTRAFSRRSGGERYRLAAPRRNRR